MSSNPVNPYKGLRKDFAVPDGFHAPEELRFEDLKAVPFNAKVEIIEPDLIAINTNQKFIRDTRGGTWPDGMTSLEENKEVADVHYAMFKDNQSYAYSVYNAHNEYIGCLYLYPIGQLADNRRRTELTPETIKYDVDMNFWVTEKAAQQGYYEKLYKAANQWLQDSFPFLKNVYCSNKVIPESEKTKNGATTQGRKENSWVDATASASKNSSVTR